MSMKAIEAKNLIDSYFNQEFLSKLLASAKETGASEDVTKFLSNYKNMEFFNDDGSMKSVETALFNNPKYEHLFTDEVMDETPEED
jgi:hypothetical protein